MSGAAAMVLAGCVAACQPAETRQASSGGAHRAPPAAPPLRVPAAAASDSLARHLVYVPAYSHIFIRDQRRRTDLAVTLSIRNTDPENPIQVTAARYYDDHGTLARVFVQAPQRLAPLATASYVVEEEDSSGGVGANFLVEWTGARGVTAPLVEAVMVSAAGTQGISFVSRGVELARP
jgi:hypothetical protein